MCYMVGDVEGVLNLDIAHGKKRKLIIDIQKL